MFVVIRDVGEYAGPKGNIVNISRRHCRIGKVTIKRPKHWGKPLMPLPGYPKDRFTFQWPAIYSQNDTPAMCRQCIGKACGNAACPSRMTVDSETRAALDRGVYI